MTLVARTSTLLLAASAAFAASGGAQVKPVGDGATFAQKAMVVSSSRIAAAAGVEVMKAGGNAVDAAVATGFALAVAYPEAGNIGGGGYMVIRMADGRTAALDYREIAPRSSFRDMFVDSAGKLTNYSVAGRSASGVPGAVAGMLAAHRRYGVLPISKVMAPAIRLAEQGMTVDSALSKSLAGKEAVLKEFAGARLFFPGGKALAPGTHLMQPELAATLRRIERDGEAGFYKGTTAAAIVAEMARGCPAGVSARARASQGCGLITAADLAAYKPVWRTPLKTGFRGYTLLSMPPSSSGGVTVGESLNILDGFPRLPAFGTAEYIHLVASAFQRAFIDRNELLGDPAFVKVPIARLTSVEHAAALRATIGKDKATPTPSLPPAVREGMETTHYSVVDAAGNAVSTTTTLNGLYGSGVYVDGAGFFLNNEMDDFASQPGQQNMFGLVQGEVNAIAAGKRMLSAMSPTIVLDSANGLFLVLGGRGGPRIITGTAQVILNVIENNMALGAAMSAPRIHHQALPDQIRIEAAGLTAGVIPRLEAMGYSVLPQTYIGSSIVAIRVVPGGLEGMDDPRGYLGGAVGY